MQGLQLLLKRARGLLARPQRLLGALAFGDILHRADHAQRHATLIANDIAAIEHMRICLTGAAEPILARPELTAIFDRSQHAGRRMLAIVGMEVLIPPERVGADFFCFVAEQRQSAIIPLEAPTYNIPIPD